MNRKDGKSKIKTYIMCNKCNDNINNISYNKHYNACKGVNKNLRNFKNILSLEKCNIKKLNENFYLCLECNKQYSKKGIGTHFWRVHTEMGKAFKANTEALKNKPGWSKGLTSETDIRIKLIAQKNSLSQKGRIGAPHTEESKAKIREKRIAYLQKKNGETAWEKRASRIPSYLENWFHENIIIKYQLTSKYDIISEYCEYPYFIDYAFINEKIAVELDGAVHFTNGDERIEHDLKRDRYLKEKGWIIYRIPYFEIQTNYQLVIETFLKFLNSLEYQEKSFENNLIKYKEYKITQKLKIKNEKEKKFHNDEKSNIEKVINAVNIDFSKLGWVEKISKLIDKKPQHINKWMKKYLPEFYEEKCFKRKSFKNK
jgi:very-short-patch-repair endonuclease